jgi:hypothetical protein
MVSVKFLKVDINFKMGHDHSCTSRNCSQVSSICPSFSGCPEFKSWSESDCPNRGLGALLWSTHASSHISCNSLFTNQPTLHCYIDELLTVHSCVAT